MNKEILNLGSKDILIAGFGREGQSTYRFIRKFFPEKHIAIADQKDINLDDKNAILHTGNDYLDSLSQYQVVFKSPGIPDSIPEIQKARKNGIEVTSQTKLFFSICEGKIIGITGTKGKSTTTSLIHHILSESDVHSVILGNIGSPSLDHLDDTLGKGRFFCFELSSYQLSDLNKSPHIGVFLNIFKEHLDYHGSEESYFQSKSNITMHQSGSDYFIYNADFEKLSKLASQTKAKSMSFSANKNISSNICIENDYLVYNTDDENEKIISINDVPLLGKHNLNNVMAAILVAKAVKIPTAKINEAISSFQPLEHRLQLAGIKNEVRFIDDALATIPEATIAAIQALSGQIGSIILGGTDRGPDFSKLAEEILKENVSAVALFPDTGDRIWNAITSQSSKLPKHIFVENMQEAVEFCYKNTPKNKVCLLSTASPSYSVFKNYEDKAKQFRLAINSLESA